ncbi:MAG: aminotransferase class I/II-fold pyridoxal phosphate-dependent enzyme, partial [Polyangiaceae bacterium]|nr:aminotransferase class I/II-fold pyridoxal phosphate-dependent enzyme [Polyangiaceae bacterium]
MGGDERRLVEEAFESNWLSTVGPHIDAFEADLGAYVGRHAVALSSGTAAIHLALRLVGVGPGDEVVFPTLTFVATVNPALYLGATPIFIDSEPGSWNLDPALLASLLESRAASGKLPKAIVPVHLYGQCADMDPIIELARRYGIAIVEDAAEALGSTYRGRKAGALAELAAFSFNGNKIITTTGGGMLIAEDPALAAKARFWATQARDPGIAYEHSELGHNYRLSNVLAAIGRGQLRVLEDRVRGRRAIAFGYRDALADLEGLELMPQAPYGLHTNWLSCFLVDEARLGCSRDALLEGLAVESIEARPVWKPMHLQPLFAGAARVGGAVAEDLFERGICLPSSTSMSAADHARVIAVVRRTVLYSREKRR